MEGIEASGYETATPVQQQVIPAILAGRDIIASAQTGTGKTAAFLLPIINRLLTHRVDGQVNAMIIVPTRELAIQIGQHLEGLSYFTNISSIAIYGGNDGNNFITEKQALKLGADIVVCTPGRMIAHLNMGYVSLKKLQFLVLDEADRMLDMGFQHDITRITSFMPQERQNLLFSATMPEGIRKLARTILRDPAEFNIAISRPPEKIVQQAFVVYETQKLPLVKHLLRSTPYKNALVFCSRKQSVRQLARELYQARFEIGEMHSDLDQANREDVLSRFAGGRLPILVATDILSRGIDIDTIDLVINYDVPRDGEDYVHRIGRTARAEADGMAFTLVGEREQQRFAAIEALLGKPVEKAVVSEELGTTPLYQPRTGKNRSRNTHKGHSARNHRNR
ncbi:MAG TPA: DEAD/DEAH box helicase [Chitinophagaceae bacterium]|nr:DEAD/DEAH box helicase [Chitinophagaceae bacterium]